MSQGDSTDGPEVSTHDFPSEPEGTLASVSSGPLCPSCGGVVVRKRSGEKAKVYCSDRCQYKAWVSERPRVRGVPGEPAPVAAGPHSMRVRQDHTAIRDQILGLLKDGAWWTVWQLAERTRCMETTASAKVRGLRNCRLCKVNCDIAGHEVHKSVIESRRLSGSAAYEYRLVRMAA